MPKIMELPAHIADLIAAGEVVERPGSVIKELVENSIDAGAAAVTVEIRRGGMSYIRVTDNGCGISPQDAQTAFLRHATSKLRTARDLEAIGTLGFRGEALAAIASVSRITMMTRESDAQEGTRVELDGGKVMETRPEGCPAGTTIIVEDLFFNTPARLKFMKNDRAEGANVSSVVLRMALSHPELSIKYIKDGSVELHTPGDGKLESCIYSTLGREFAAGLLETYGENDGVTVTGYVSSPANCRGNRSWQFFFLNGRHIKSKTLTAAVEQAFRNSLFTGKFPVCVLNIRVSPAAVDVNVHPAKTEVRFSNEKVVFDAVYYAVLGALEGQRKSAELTISEGTKKVLPSPKTDFSSIGQEPSAPNPAAAPANSGYKAKPREDFFTRLPAGSGIFSGGGTAKATHSEDALPKARAEIKKIINSFKDISLTFRSDSVVDEKQMRIIIPPSALGDDSAWKIPGALPEVKVEQDPATGKTSVVHPEEKSFSTSAAGSSASFSTETPIITSEKDEPDFRIIGEALTTYIIAEKGESIFLIDKHAAHEREIFDRLKAYQGEPASQMLLTPVVCDMGHSGASVLLDNADLLAGYGFDISDYGGGKIALRQIPLDLEDDDPRTVLETLSQELESGKNSLDGLKDGIMHTVACRAAIKAGRSTDVREVRELTAKVLSGQIKYCPHGRPVSVEITKTQLDRNFKRI